MIQLVRKSVQRVLGELRWRVHENITNDDGMSTVEYAVGTVAAAAFGAILYSVVTGDNVVSALTNIVTRALNTKTG